MQQQISVLTLGVVDLDRSRRFYVEGFGWQPVFANGEIAFYQMNGFVLGTWSKVALEADMNRAGLSQRGAFLLAHNVLQKQDVAPLMDRLASAGTRSDYGNLFLILHVDEPAHGGFRGYIADPDDHVWEIAWNPAWKIDAHGLVTFGV